MERAMPQATNHRDHATDLQTQLESLLNTVWRSERMWRLEDRIDLQIEADRTLKPVRGEENGS